MNESVVKKLSFLQFFVLIIYNTYLRIKGNLTIPNKFYVILPQIV
jgi:hypothetical protein